jgi:hypothetical protein
MKKTFLVFAAIAFMLAASGVTMMVVHAQSVLACATPSC